MSARLSDLLSEIRYAWRSLRRRPGAALVVVLTLALGLGINATFFSSFHAMVTRPLPFDQANRLVMVTQSKPDTGQTFFQVSQGNALDVRSQMTSFERVEPFDHAGYHVETGAAPERVSGARISAGLFPLLGVEPAHGRGFVPADDEPGASPVALISDRLWQKSFGGDASVLGRQILIDGTSCEIVGIMEPGFQFPHTQDLWTPLQLDHVNALRSRSGLNVSVLARLNEGVAVEAALAEAQQLGSRLAQQYPESNEGWSFHVRSLHDAWMPPVTQTAAWAMQVLVGLVLLIVCVNVANMVLVQATARTRETALRTALGAGRLRLLRQGLVETLLLAAAGGGLGLLLTVWQGDWMQRISAIEIPYWLDFRIDGVVVAFAAVCTVLVGLFLGLLPWLRLPWSRRSDAGMADQLRGGGRGDSGTSGGRLRRALVVVEYAMAVIILVGAFLMVRAYQEVRERDPGFDVDGLVTAQVHFADDVEARRGFDFLQRAIERLGSAPGVESVAVAARLPISRRGVLAANLEVEGRTFEVGEEPYTSLTAVSGDFFRTLGIEPRRGRLFESTELAEAAEVALIDESLAEMLWPESDPIGRRIREQGEEAPWLTIIGTVSSVEPGEMLAGIDANPPYQVYVPMSFSMAGVGANAPDAPDAPDATGAGWGPITRSPSLILKSDLTPVAVTDLLRRELSALDVSVPVYDVMTMGRALDQHYFAQHIWGVLFSIIAAVALLIAAVGAYGVTAYSVARRRRELAIRLALGASPKEVLQSVVRQGLGLALWGLAFGVLGAAPLAMSLNRLLHGVSPFDPLVFGGVATLLLALAVAASAAPARRAAGVDPAVALRDE